MVQCACDKVCEGACVDVCLRVCQDIHPGTELVVYDDAAGKGLRSGDAGESSFSKPKAWLKSRLISVEMTRSDVNESI